MVKPVGEKEKVTTKAKERKRADIENWRPKCGRGPEKVLKNEKGRVKTAKSNNIQEKCNSKDSFPKKAWKEC